jgi:hypothetical protein
MFCRGNDASDICCMASKFSVVSDQGLEIMSLLEGRMGVSRSDHGLLSSRNEEKCSSESLNAYQLFSLLSILFNYTKIYKVTFIND